MKIHPTPLAGSIAGLLIFAGIAVAQDTPQGRLKRPATEAIAPAGASLSEVVVTAASDRSYTAPTAVSTTRLAEPILDTPRSVQVVTRQVLEDRAVNDPQEAVQNVSGVQRSASFNGIGETYLLRGFRQADLIKDGFRAGSTPGGGELSATGATDMANIDRVEVLKGPAAILYGRGEPGGAVNYVTKMPAFENRFSLEQSVGSYDFYCTELGANWNAVADRVALRLDAAYDRGDSYLDFVEGERWFVAPAFKLQLGEKTTLTFRGEYSHDERSTIPGVPYVNGQVLPGSPYNRYYGEPGFTEFTNEVWRGVLQLEHRWTDNIRTTLSLHGRQSEQEGAYFILFNFAGPAVDPITGDVARSVAITDFTDENFTARLDQVFDWTVYQGPTNTLTDKDGKSVATSSGGFPTVKNQLVLSAEYDRQTAEHHRQLGAHSALNAFDPKYRGYAPSPLLPFPGFPFPLNEFTESEAEAFSLLLLDRISFGESVYLSFGGRVEWFNSDSSTLYPDPGTPFASTSSSQDIVTFNPSAGLVVKPARNVSLYASYAESTNAFIGTFSSPTVSGEPADPEHSRQYEVGAKAEFFDQRLLVSASVFQIEKSDVIGTDPANPLFSINSGDERSRGFEMDIAGEPLPGWRIMANYAYTDARITDAPLGLNVGHRRFGVPENSGGFFTTYEIQGGAMKGFGFGGGMYFSDRVEVDNANSGNLSGFTQTDAVLYYRRDRFKVQLNVKNLFDNESYYSQNSATTVQSAPARTIVASVKFEF